MLRKLVLSGLVLAVTMSGFAKKTAVNESVAKENAKHATIKLLNELQINLQNGKSIPDHDGKRDHNVGTQFLYNQALVEENLKLDNTDGTKLKKVYDKLKDLAKNKKQPRPTVFKYENVHIGTITESTSNKWVKVNSGEGKDEVQRLQKKFYQYIPVVFETHTISGDSLSNVKYRVTYTWKVELNPQPGNTDKSQGKDAQAPIVRYTLGKPSLEEIKAEPIDHLTSEEESIKDRVQKEINGWYANLPQGINEADMEYVEVPVTVTRPKNETKVGAVDRTFTVKGETATMDIDRDKFIPYQDRYKYTIAKPSLMIKPEFNVTVNEDYSDYTMDVKYKATTSELVTDERMVERYTNAVAVVEDYYGQLSTYVSSRSRREQKAYIEGLFSAPNDTVEIARIIRNGKEPKVKANPVKKYLTLLNGTKLEMNAIDLIDYEQSQMDTIVFDVIQEYEGRKYHDTTRKRIYLQRVPDTDNYVITKIAVLPDSTKLIKEEEN